MGPVK